MKIAISTDAGRVSEHFGRCPEFTILTLRDGCVAERETIPNPGHHPGYLPRFFNDMGVQCIIAGGMGQRASLLFDEFQIEPVLGITGTIEEVVEHLENGTLKGGESLCSPGRGKGYGEDKSECDHDDGSHDAH